MGIASCTEVKVSHIVFNGKRKKENSVGRINRFCSHIAAVRIEILFEIHFCKYFLHRRLKILFNSYVFILW